MCDCANICENGHMLATRTIRDIVRSEIARYDLQQRKARGEKVEARVDLHRPYRVRLNGEEPAFPCVAASEIEGWVDCWPKRIGDMTQQDVQRGPVRHYGIVQIELIEE